MPVRAPRAGMFLASLSALVSLAAEPAPPARDLPGPLPDGAVLLPNQWVIRPVGEQIGVGDFPVNLATHPLGKFAAVLHCGYGKHEIVILDLAKKEIASRAPVDEAFYGLAFSRDGSRLFCSGSAGETLHAFHFDAGKLTDHTTIALRDRKQRGIPAGFAVSADAGTIYVANLWGQSVSRVRLGEDAPQIEDMALGEKPAEKSGAAEPATSTDDPSITKRDLVLLDTTDPGAPFPYACVLDEKRERLYVSLWGQTAVAVIDTAAWKLLARWETEEHPNEMLLSKDGRRLFVANANRNTVSIIDTATGKTAESLLASLTPDAPPGNTPNALALTRDGRTLFVANANINAVSVFDVAEPGKSRALGFIPAGWYPTSVRLTTDGKSLLIVNGKGGTSFANPKGPVPGKKGEGTQYIGGLMRGSVGIVPLPAEEKREEQMKAWTATAFAGLPKAPAPPVAADAAALPIPLKPGDASPIKYVIYIVKENRTYDQVLGDIKEGNGDASLCLFDEKITPNHHALAREFVLLDNFYVDAEVSADGHEWSMAAYATDFVEKSWPLSYGHDKSGKFPYPSEGNFPMATPAGGYLFDRAKQAGVTYRSYGEFVHNGKKLADPCTTRLSSLKGHFDPFFRSFDTGYPDQKRADRFIAELHRFEEEGDMPRLQIVRLPNDHTSGTSPGKPTPFAAVADNDLAFGRLVEAVSKSKFWEKTAIFVLEDDAQNGPDHVDAHRSIAFAISPYIRRGAVDSTMYSTSSMLRTIELILGLKPMSQFDAAAMPMSGAFTAKPDAKPYEARPAAISLEDKNSLLSFGARASQKMDFTKEDAIDDLKLNDILWRSIKGADVPCPPPRRAAFVFVQKKKADKDDD